MAIKTRKKIGILFNFSGSWLGGVYYVQNIIKALNFLGDDEKPEIIIFYKKELSNFALEIDYKYLTTVEWNFESVYKGFLKSWIYRKNVFVDQIINEYDLDGVYPLYDHPVSHKKVKGNAILAAWFPDLQHKFYPNYFNKLNLILRELRLKLILKNASTLVVSSFDVKNHFKKFYKIKTDFKIKVLQFVSIIDNFNVDFNKIKIKYNLPDEYFMVSNQFYEHKNHIILFKALGYLKSQNKNLKVVLTGKMEDYRNPVFIENLKQAINKDKIEDNIKMLGVIPREEQLCIMQNSKAIIQPSLFEGWSTVIEDAKSLQRPVICSNIPIHKEQLEDLGTYFNPSNYKELASLMEGFESTTNVEIYDKYENRVTNFARNFLSIFE